MSYQVIDDIPVWGDPQDDAVRQARDCLRGAERIALMADHHLGYSQPVGGVVAYEGFVSPSGVGYDIACGNKAVRVDMPADELRERIETIMDDVWSVLEFGIGRKNAEHVDHEVFHDDPGWDVPAAGRLKTLARSQMGTIGSGNHYVDLFTDEEDRVWIGVHFGSRGLGHKLATHFIRAGGGREGMFVSPTLLRDDSDLGEQYLACMKLAGRYAYAGRDWVCDRVAGLLGTNILEEVHNHHNFAWRERHGDRDLWVVRKGATPAFPGQRGFVGGSMGDVSVILEGVESDESRAALYSTVHGAGRVMSRTRAAGKRRRRLVCARCGWRQQRPRDHLDACPKCRNRDLRKQWVTVQEGEITRRMMEAWVRRAGVTLRGAGTDESPHVYKRLPDVLWAHGETIRVLHTLTPVGVAMAGEDEFDPFRD